MIEVKNLIKKYESTLAVDDLTFTVSRGQIVGFLGANGAGKTTTMRIISGYMPATDGCVNVSGFDVYEDSLLVRQNVGYLPENVPLYLDMRVYEFLLFRSRLKGFIKSKAKKHVYEIMEKCWITDVKDKIIGHLSKGYRQRVALADALLNNPELLILDEPTVGLDPKQIIKVRELIKELGQSHTIFLSSHILPEVEAVCDEILIIDKGKIIAEGTAEDLRENLFGGHRIQMEIKANSEEDINKGLSEIKSIKNISIKKLDEFYEIMFKGEEDLRETIYNLCIKKKWVLRELKKAKETLEDVFVQLTTSEDVLEKDDRKEGDTDE